jgi:hypothetical protein
MSQKCLANVSLSNFGTPVAIAFLRTMSRDFGVAEFTGIERKVKGCGYNNYLSKCYAIICIC